MRKMIVSVLASLVLFGCDTERNPVNSTTKTDTVYSVTTIIKNKISANRGVVLKDTITSKKDTNIILGSFVPKEGSPISGIVVCSDKIGRCAKSNSKGIFQIIKQTNSFAGRLSSAVDTTATPENASLSLPNDTVIDTIPVGESVISRKDTIITFDTLKTDTGNVVTKIITINDSAISVDTSKIVVTVNIPDTVGVKDTLTYINNGTVLSEVPIESWGFILPPNYIVQRNIEAIDSTWDGCIRKVEVVYFLRGDSVAKVVSLENVGTVFTGFIYTLYNDSSYRNNDKIYNIFFRARGDSGRLIVKTEVETFSERLGDFPTKGLKTKVGVQEYNIVPAFIPAARNNEKLGESVVKFSQTVDTIEYVGIEFLPGTWTIGPAGDRFSVQRMNWDSLGIDSASFDVESTADSLRIGFDDATLAKRIYLTSNLVKIQKHITISLPSTSNEFAIGPHSPNTKNSETKITNIRFHYKK